MFSRVRNVFTSRAVLYRAAIESTLQDLYDTARRITLTRRDRMVIMSDLHMGDGGSRDDFRHNAELVQTVLREHYLAGGFSLVLNGDIEELQRFRLPAIRAQWKELFELFEEFRARTALYKIIGNHDDALHAYAAQTSDRSLLDSLRLSYQDKTLFLFHGHQATIFFERFNDISGFFLRYGANALRIHNAPVTYESQKKFRTEHRVYSFSSSRKIVSLIGHTHRPLFESLSKIDTLRFRIEQLCREYNGGSRRVRRTIETAIGVYRRELTRLWERDREDGLRSSLYNEEICVPCLFNSGCAIGKRGVTALEIENGQIALVYWFDPTRPNHTLEDEGQPAEKLGQTGFYRTVLKQDKLEYIFARIRLLA
jgi:UDP-2,3-diacylglucosamine pyrophosphatase LpxH